ncbi:hypothetical protein EVJ50_13075 [Synechococcus sp. RSCCF101]|uniref:hypothetical protein n=1 Tax=Synechococcus sp. RSCCF101 TaxID=2511069 RepID=UPI001248945C|nr:hypothetical protein [Synechococcus sp. RSCCF101]QEY33020.1 hypothetical protein EVJ50_13075 [Synechococcus sp. RSCCF101]
MSIALLLLTLLAAAPAVADTPQPRPKRAISSEELEELIRNQSDADLDATIRREFEASERSLRQLGIAEPTTESIIREWQGQQSGSTAPTAGP